MRETIWKYTFRLNTERFEQIDMPIGAHILCVQAQDDKPILYALVNPNNECESRTFELMETGAEFYSTKRCYIGTTMLYGGSYVLHIFEIGRP